MAAFFFIYLQFYAYKMLDNIRIKSYNIIRKRERERPQRVLEIGTARKPAKKGSNENEHQRDGEKVW